MKKAYLFILFFILISCKVSTDSPPIPINKVFGKYVQYNENTKIELTLYSNMQYRYQKYQQNILVLESNASWTYYVSHGYYKGGQNYFYLNDSNIQLGRYYVCYNHIFFGKTILANSHKIVADPDGAPAINWYKKIN